MCVTRLKFQSYISYITCFLVFFIFNMIIPSDFLRSIKQNTGGQEYPICNKNKKC